MEYELILVRILFVSEIPEVLIFCVVLLVLRGVSTVL